MVEPGSVIERVILKVYYIIIVIDSPFCVMCIRIFGLESVQDCFRRFDAALFFTLLLNLLSAGLPAIRIAREQIVDALNNK